MKSLLLYFIFLAVLFAHPHTFIDVYPTIKMKEGATNTINFRWKMDEMTSTMLIMDIDRNGDGKIDFKENEYIRDNYFTVLENYNYYTHIKIDNELIEFPSPKNFRAYIENHRVVYSFDIEGDFHVSNTVMEFGDSDFYVALVLKNDFITISGANASATGIDNDFYYGYKLEFK